MSFTSAAVLAAPSRSQLSAPDVKTSNHTRSSMNRTISLFRKVWARFTPINVHIRLINNCHQHVNRGVTDRHMIRQLNHQRNSWHLNQTISCEKHKLNCPQNTCYNSPKTSGNVHYLKKCPRKMENKNEIKSLIWNHFRSVTDNIVCSLSHLKEPSQKMTPFNETLWPQQHRGVESFTATV